MQTSRIDMEWIGMYGTRDPGNDGLAQRVLKIDK